MCHLRTEVQVETHPEDGGRRSNETAVVHGLQRGENDARAGVSPRIALTIMKSVNVHVTSQKAEQILGVTAATLGDYSENNPDEMDRIFAASMFRQFHFRLRGRMEVFQVSILSKGLAQKFIVISLESSVALD